MSRSQRRIHYHLKQGGFLVDQEQENILREFNLSSEIYRNKPDTDKRRILTMLYELGYINTANYLKTTK